MQSNQLDTTSTVLRLQNASLTSAQQEDVVNRKQSLAERLGVEEGAWHPGPEHAQKVKKWRQWASKKFKDVAGEDGHIDRENFKHAFKIKDVRQVYFSS